MTEFSSHQLAGIAGGLKFFFIGTPTDKVLVHVKNRFD